MDFIKNRCLSRLALVQYIFSQYFSENNIDTFLQFFINQFIQYLEDKKDDTDFSELNITIDSFNKKFIRSIYEVYLDKKEKIETVIKNISNREEDNIDLMILAIIYSACAEMHITNSKVVISEYLKIALILNVNNKFVNGLLDRILQENLLDIDFQALEEKQNYKKNHIESL
jgi:transcription termination factor NusB